MQLDVILKKELKEAHSANQNLILLMGQIHAMAGVQQAFTRLYSIDQP